MKHAFSTYQDIIARQQENKARDIERQRARKLKGLIVTNSAILEQFIEEHPEYKDGSWELTARP